ncbi:MAG: HAMP domain-containing histidine kinase, partial [Planctomycetaceae bacterium]|nr:HAMP domain-containing histidine kinase [Planctomycetaceae bacterium]
GQLAAGLAHELRNPLTAVRTLVEAARSRGAAAQLDGRDLEVVEEEISRLDSTLQSFLDYARPPVLERRPVDVRDVIQRTVQLVNARAEIQSVHIETSLPADPLVVSADSEQLRQVLLNLLLNALDSLGSGGRITVSAAAEPATGQVLLQIADTGPGIPAAVRDTLFDPFVSSKPSGTGLGLTICRRIVENHGGTIAAENSPTGGAVFSVKLPSP